MAEIQLSDEQRRAVQANPGKPVDVVDPATQRGYVLLARELYERVRPLLEGGPGPATVAAPVPAPAPEGPPPRVRLRDLPMPPEVAAVFRERCRTLPLFWRKQKQEEEDQLKLQHYFGGQPVYVVRTPEGPVVIPIEERYWGTPDLRYVLLTPEERAQACYGILPRLFDTVNEVLSPFPNES